MSYMMSAHSNLFLTYLTLLKVNFYLFSHRHGFVVGDIIDCTEKVQEYRRNIMLFYNRKVYSFIILNLTFNTRLIRI